MQFAEQFTRWLEILAETPGGQMVLIIAFLGVLANLLLVGGLIFLAVRTNGSVSKQTDAMNKQMEFFGRLNETQSQLLSQLTISYNGHTTALDKIGDGQQAANELARRMHETLQAVAAQGSETRRIIHDQNLELLTSVQAVDEHTTLILETAQATRQDVGQVGEAVRAHDQNHDQSMEGIATVIGMIKTATDTLIGAMDTLSKKAATKTDVESLTQKTVTKTEMETLTREVHGLNELVRLLDQKLTENQKPC